VPELVALVDLGSNAVRFVVARITPGVDFRVLREERAQTQLGGGAPGRLPPAAVKDTLRAVHEFLRDVRDRGRARVLAVATAAVREAVDAQRLLDALRDREGLDIRILSVEEEARLGVEAALWSLPVRDAVVVDLGGGSVQMSRVRQDEIVSISSAGLGAVRMTRQFLRHDPPRAGEIDALRREVRRQAEGLMPRVDEDHPLVGLGGSVRALARFQRGDSRDDTHGLRLRRRDIERIGAHLAALPLEDRRRQPGLKASRARTIVAGAVVLDELMALGGYATVTVCGLSVRHGVLARETMKGPVAP
jgi:exopolyphosphatase/guanosine-5'-triphosphate,3'-diphosphate pyrophosphatase